MDRNENQQQKDQKPESHKPRDWEQSEWFEKWLELIRQRPQRAAA